MDENLVGYLLNTLDAGEQRQVEAYLAGHPEARQRLELLRHSLEPLAADRAETAPPPDLVVRTIARVAEYCVRERDLPRAPAAPPRSFTPSRPLWRRADVLVAASLLLTALGLAIPAILHLRTPRAVLECQNNLQLVYGALKAYHDHHGKFPDVAAEKPHGAAGLAVPLLVNAGVWPEGGSVCCPGNGPPRACSVPLDQLKNMAPDEFKQVASTLVPCYAYSLGYMIENTYHPPACDPNQPNSLLPLVADVVPMDMTFRNSLNHGGRGQNVLFQDGHVRFTVLRTVGLDGDDIYVNRDQKIAAGLGRRDTVLGPSNSYP
jgi:prepilin-type processing-associated H-X9-DG protein